MALEQKSAANPPAAPSKSVAPVKPSASAKPAISLDLFKTQIEKRAKEIFLKRQESKAQGDALSDWLQAEKEIKAKYHIV
jgi:Protein of unknown function (DUF2934)